MKLIFRKTVSYIFVLLVLGFIVSYLAYNWKSVSSVRWWENPGLLSIHIVLMALTFSLFVIGWQRLLKMARTPVSNKAAGCAWLIPNIGKYVPGKVFMVAGRVALLTTFGVRAATAASLIIWEHVILILAAMPFSLFILLNYSEYYPLKIIVAVISVLFLLLLISLNSEIIQSIINSLLKVFKKPPLELVLQRKTVMSLFFFYLFIWIIYGFSGVILAYALGFGDKIPLLLLFNVFIFSWLIGFISMITPGGIGVREGILILMIKPYVAMPEVIVFALLARMTWIITELVGVIAGLILGNKLDIKHYFNIKKRL